MSKHLGNILEPIPLMDEHGADAVRWFMAAGGSPWAARRVGHATIQEIVRKMLLTYWNTVAFQVLYARTGRLDAVRGRPGAGRAPGARPLGAVRGAPAGARGRPRRWRTSTPSGPARCSSAFVDDLSNWYVRRSRRRFWDGDPAALATLHECLTIVTLLMAPLTPFITERVWQDLFARRRPARPSRCTSPRWPDADAAAGRRRARGARWRWSAGWSSSAGPRGPSAKVKTRQPLRPGAGRRARLGASCPTELRARDRRGAERRAARAARAAARRPGRRTAPRATSARSASGSASDTPQVAAAIAAADAGALAAALRAGGTRDGRPSTASRSRSLPDEVIVTETPREGWSVVNEQRRDRRARPRASPRSCAAPASPARWSGWSRRRARPAGFDVSDRIALAWQATAAETRDALAAHRARSPRRCWPWSSRRAPNRWARAPSRTPTSGSSSLSGRPADRGSADAVQGRQADGSSACRHAAPAMLTAPAAVFPDSREAPAAPPYPAYPPLLPVSRLPPGVTNNTAGGEAAQPGPIATVRLRCAPLRQGARPIAAHPTRGDTLGRDAATLRGDTASSNPPSVGRASPRAPPHPAAAGRPCTGVPGRRDPDVPVPRSASHQTRTCTRRRGTTPDRGHPAAQHGRRKPSEPTRSQDSGSSSISTATPAPSAQRRASDCYDSGSSSIRKPRIGDGACGMPGFGCGGTPGRIGAIVWVIWLIAEPAMAGAGCGIPGFGAGAA